MKIERFVIGPIGTNCYIVINEETKECFVADPAACPPELVSHIRSTGLKVQAVLLTHGHFDHIMGIDDFVREFPVPVYAHEAEKGAAGECTAELIGNVRDGIYLLRSRAFERRPGAHHRGI